MSRSTAFLVHSFIALQNPASLYLHKERKKKKEEEEGEEEGEEEEEVSTNSTEHLHCTQLCLVFRWASLHHNKGQSCLEKGSI